ncbi:hypothetical protein [Streptomyces sp. NPDC006879]|uniref:hypothetical protein n=1 Tax=Streptomyces sp. NPDC006879 TaxID=3364767 RepID=UPI0036CD5897
MSETWPAGGDGADGTVEPAVPEQPTGPVGPTPLGVPRTSTGRPEVDALLERLADADHLPAEDHLQVYEDVDRGLRAVLTGLDAHPASEPHENRS